MKDTTGSRRHTGDHEKAWSNDRFQCSENKTRYHKAGETDTKVRHNQTYAPSEDEESEVDGDWELVKEHRERIFEQHTAKIEDGTDPAVLLSLYMLYDVNAGIS